MPSIGHAVYGHINPLQVVVADMQPWPFIAMEILAFELDVEDGLLGFHLDVAQLVAIARRVARPMPQGAVGEGHSGGVVEQTCLGGGDELALLQVAIFGEQRVAPSDDAILASIRSHPQVCREGGRAVARLLIIVVGFLVLSRLPCDGAEEVAAEHLRAGHEQRREGCGFGAGQQGRVGEGLLLQSQGAGIDGGQGGMRRLGLKFSLFQQSAHGGQGVVTVGLPHQRQAEQVGGEPLAVVVLPQRLVADALKDVHLIPRLVGLGLSIDFGPELLVALLGFRWQNGRQQKKQNGVAGPHTLMD